MSNSPQISFPPASTTLRSSSPSFCSVSFRDSGSCVIIHLAYPEQFSKYANMFFLFTACIQQIPDVSPTNPYTTIVPLGVVLLASAFKEVQEDLVRLLQLHCVCPRVNCISRNDINQTLSSIHARQRFWSHKEHLWSGSGRTFVSVMWCGWKATTLSRPTCFSSVPANRKDCAISRPPILMGMFSSFQC